jgi:hypothetical protein
VNGEAFGTCREQEIPSPGALQKCSLMGAQVERVLEFGRLAGSLGPEE